MSSAAIADRNLIFAILAVQNDFVSRDGVIAAMNAWISAKHKPISQILVEQGTLDPEDASAIDGMISRIIRKSGGDVRKTLENLSSMADLAEPLAALGDTDLTASVSIYADIPTFVANPQAAKAAGPRLSPGPDSPPAGPILSDPDGEFPENLNITPAPEPRPGDVIGRFRIIRLIGKGGQGAVYEALDLSELDRTVALKTTLESQFDHIDSLRRRRARLLHEGRLNARLEHQYIIPIHGLGTTEDGRPYYAMRFLNQINLDTAIRNFHAGRDLLFDPRKPAKVVPAGKANQAGPVVSPENAAPTELPKTASGNARPDVPAGQNPPVSGSTEASPIEPDLIQLDRLEGQKNLDFRDLLERFTDVCQAMHFAHTRRVLHRDLKPGNIMIGNNRETLVIDWGMAKTRAELQAEATKARPDGAPTTISLEIDPRHRMSMAGHFIGTPGYAPPEQLEGDLTKLNETTDVYALGMILFEILTGQNPFHTDELRNTPRDRWHIWLRDKALIGAPDPLAHNPTVPKPLAAICRKALAPDQKNRYATADELSEDVSNWLADERVTAYRETLPERSRRWIRKNRGKAATAAATLAFLALGSLLTVVFLAQYNRDVTAERDRATQNLDNAQRSLYASNLLLAQNAFENGDMRQALARLDDCQWNLRGWEHAFLRRRFDSSRQTLFGHISSVSSVAFSPDGTRILTGSGDTTAKLWDSASGRELRTFIGHSGHISSVAFSPDGSRILTGSWDDTAKLWDTATGRELLTLQGPIIFLDSVSSVAFSPDGARILTGCGDATAKLWDTATGRVLLTIKGHSEGVTSVAFNPEGSRILTGSRDGTAKIWDAASGLEILTLKGHSHIVFCVAFSPDGTRILTGSRDNTARLWDTATGRELLTLKGQSSHVFNHFSSVSFSPDGSRILTGCWDNSAKLWDAFSGRELLTFKGHSGVVSSVSFSPDGTRILTGSEDATAKLWDTATEQEICALKGHTFFVESVAFSPNGKRILTGSLDSTAKLWDSASGRELRTFNGHSSGISSVACSLDGTLILTGSYDKTAKLWDTASGRVLLTLKGHSEGVYCVAVSPDGTKILTGSSDKTAKLWDAVSGRELLTLKGHSDLVSSVTFSPDGLRFLTGSKDRTAKLWDAASGRDLLTLKWHESDPSVAFSPDGSRILTGSADTSAKLWETASGRELLTLEGHADRISTLAFSPDGSRILTGSRDKTAKLWDAASGQELLTLKGHSDFVSSLDFSLDGLRILTGSYDNTAKLWDTETGMELLTLTGHSDIVFNVDFSPDGSRILTGSRGNTAKLWKIASGREHLRLGMDHFYVTSLGFTPDGNVLFAKYRNGKHQAWNMLTGQSVPPSNPPAEFEEKSAVSPDGRYRAEIRGRSIVLIPLKEPLTGTEPWPLPNRDERFEYHGEQAAGFETSGKWFAAAFHLKRMLTEDPNNTDLKKRLEAAIARQPKQAGSPPNDRKLSPTPDNPANPFTLPENPFQP